MMTGKIRHSLIALCLIAFTFSTVSCIPHIHGNGKVVKEERTLSNFEALEVSNGIDVLVTQDAFEKVVVEVDENLLKILKTEVNNGILKIFLEENILHAKQLKVYVTLKKLKSIETGSGSSVKSENKITTDNLKMSSSSGSRLSMEVSCGQLSAETSSGSSIKITGTAQSFQANSSSGSRLNASGLMAENGKLSSSSGSHMDAQITKEIKAHASSGASISVLGNPPVRDTNSSSGGSVHFK
jgi:hypothetical protein